MFDIFAHKFTSGVILQDPSDVSPRFISPVRSKTYSNSFIIFFSSLEFTEFRPGRIGLNNNVFYRPYGRRTSENKDAVKRNEKKKKPPVVRRTRSDVFFQRIKNKKNHRRRYRHQVPVDGGTRTDPSLMDTAIIKKPPLESRIPLSTDVL